MKILFGELIGVFESHSGYKVTVVHVIGDIIIDSLNLLLDYCSAAEFTHRIKVIFVGEVELVDLRFESFEYFAVTCHVGGQYQHYHTLQCIHNDPQIPALTEIQSKTKRKRNVHGMDLSSYLLL